MTLNLKGVGPGFRKGTDAFMINCPLIFNSERLTRSSFRGVKLSAAAGLGGSVGIFSNKRLGVCVMTSLSGGIGAGISGAKMTFKNR